MVPVCASHPTAGGGSLFVPPTPQLVAVGGFLCTYNWWGGEFCVPPPHNGVGPVYASHPITAEEGEVPICVPPPQHWNEGDGPCAPPPKINQTTIWGGVPISIIPMIWVKGPGESLEIAKPPQSHTHTHTHVHTHAHAEPPPSTAFGVGGALRLLLVTVCPPPTLWGP